MAVTSELDVVAVPAAGDAPDTYVDWPAIFGGIVLASAISILLLTFGSAVGLGFTNFNARPDVSPIWLAIAAASWLLWVQVSSFMAGAYLTGRLRKRHGDATEAESDVRDGAHGLLVWAGALVVGAVLAVGGIGATASAVGSAAATVTTAASNVAGGAGDALDPNAYFVDSLFRVPASGTAAAEAAATTEPAPAPAETPAATTETPATTTSTEQSTTATPATTTSTAAATPAEPTVPAATAEPDAAAANADREAVRGEVGRIFARAAVTEVPETDRAYLAQLVSDQTGMSDEAAAARVDEVMAAMQAARDEAAEVAEEARKMAVLAAFLIAASLLVSAIGAYWAAQKGGNHRDNETDLSGWFRRF
jgi:hypothetical protein